MLFWCSARSTVADQAPRTPNITRQTKQLPLDHTTKAWKQEHVLSDAVLPVHGPNESWV